jgi:hypothetical protein
MKRLLGLSLFVLVLFAGGWLVAQDVKGTLPANWGKLGLSDEQKQKVYKAQADHKTKIAALEKQIKELKEEEKTAMEAVLTPAQKARLKEILLGKVPADK